MAGREVFRGLESAYRSSSGPTWTTVANIRPSRRKPWADSGDRRNTSGIPWMPVGRLRRAGPVATPTQPLPPQVPTDRPRATD